MREGWTYKKLGEVCEIVMGQSPDGNSINENEGIEFHQGKTCFGERFLTHSSLYTSKPAKYAEANSVLLCVRAPVGFPNITKRRICIGRGLCSLVNSEEITNMFLFYSLLGKQGYFEKNSIGSTFKAISSKVISNTIIPVPSLSEQQSIVAELDKINELISLKKAQLSDFDSLAQSIFYDMFGDPIENEKEWEVKEISKVANYYNGTAHEQDIDNDGKYILVNAKFIASEGAICKRTSIQRFPLYENDIVMVLSDVPNGKALAKCYLIRENNSYSLNQRICAFREYKQNPIYLLFVLNRNSYFLGFDDGKGQTNLRKNEVINCPVPLPPLPLQQEFAKRIELIEQQKAQISSTIKDLETLLASRMQYWFD